MRAINTRFEGFAQRLASGVDTHIVSPLRGSHGNSSMQLLFISTAGHFGGTERWASMAIAELERRGHEVWMDCPDLPHAARFASAERLWHGGPRGAFDTEGKARLEAFCREHKIEALIPVSQKAYFPAGQVARKLGIGCIVRLGIVRFPWRPVLDWYGYGLYPHAIIVNTNRIKQVLARAPFVKRERIHVIYNGIVRKELQREPIMPGKFVITTVGTLSWRKGQQHLLKAIAMLPGHLRERVVVKLIGDGPARPTLEAFWQKLGLKPGQVVFTGHVDNPVDHVAASNLFVLLSSQEGISNALLEAMDADVPAYATLVGGHGEFIEDGVNAFATRARNPRHVSADLERIMTSGNLGIVAARGRDTVRKLFSIQAMGDRLEAVISGAIAEARNATNPDA
jgi:glycosyltransferase involved in cell wall biosynthesis